MSKTTNKCTYEIDNKGTYCGKQGLPGLLRGEGRCRYHWALMNWGKDWADKVAKETPLNAPTQT